MSETPYFHRYLDRHPQAILSMNAASRYLWQLLASATVGFGVMYLYWRWTETLNAEALLFSTLVATSETLAFLGSVLFFYDIWDEKERTLLPPDRLLTAGTKQVQHKEVKVDIFITTFDETVSIVEPSIAAAKQLCLPDFVQAEIFLLDDGNRQEMGALAQRHQIGYFRREHNRGFKAGNLAHALFQTDGAFFIICDADTQLFPSFLQNTLGYFSDPKVSWVQTPHWFYDIPEGRTWREWLYLNLRIRSRWLEKICILISGRNAVGRDPFMVNPSVFFDVIQRRRDRHDASFCCGAGSIHRREAVWQNALIEDGRSLRRLSSGKPQMAAHLGPHLDLQPFKHHVSEDLYTSIQAHSNGWKSVYHPKVEARMLSPWSASAWAIQRLKYAGGTFDILFWKSPRLLRDVPLKIRLHYYSTFWSYLSILWLPILLLAPAYSLFTGRSPVDAYSIEFFARLLPVIILNELALNATSKGYDLNAGRVLALGTISIQLRALLSVLLRQKPKFPATPKKPASKRSWRFSYLNLSIIAVLVGALLWASAISFFAPRTYDTAFLIVNVFWIFWGVVALVRATTATLAVPARAFENEMMSMESELND